MLSVTGRRSPFPPNTCRSDVPTGQRLDEIVAERAGVTRARARSLIIAGRVRVDGRPLTKPGTAVRPSSKLEVERPRPYVSRGGEKLEGALRDSKWNKTRAAERLGVSPKTLLAKLRAVGLEQ